MKHIITKALWGKEEIDCHTLKLTAEEYEQLESFLKSLGIELRTCSLWWEDGVRVGEYQARNAFRTKLQCRDNEAYEQVKADIERGWWRR